jgi:hypothetical protein
MSAPRALGNVASTNQPLPKMEELWLILIFFVILMAAITGLIIYIQSHQETDRHPRFDGMIAMRPPPNIHRQRDDRVAELEAQVRELKGIIGHVPTKSALKRG